MYVFSFRSPSKRRESCDGRDGLADCEQIKYLRVPDEIVDLVKEQQQSQQGSGYRGRGGAQRGDHGGRGGDRGRGGRGGRGRGRGRGS
jgi:hypothetical protein